MKKYYDTWLPVLENFQRTYDDLCYKKNIDTPKIVDWHPSGYLELTVKVDTGEILVYEFIGDRIYPLRNGNGLSILEQRRCEDETSWKNNFSKNLRIRIQRRGISNDKLSSITGISRVTLSKYLNGKAIPNSYNMEQLSYALGCSVSELTMVR